MAALTCRGFIEPGAGDPEAESTRQRLFLWLTTFPIEGGFSNEETEVIRAPLGALTADQTLSATWTVEGLVLLAWALELTELPAYDDQVDPYEVAETVGLLDSGVSQRFNTATLRDPEEIAACREFYYAVHARVRDSLRNPGQRFRRPFLEWLDPNWFVALKLHPDLLVADEDLAIGGKPAWKVPREQLLDCEQIVRERHRATIWLAGEEGNYWDVRADT